MVAAAIARTLAAHGQAGRGLQAGRHRARRRRASPTTRSCAAPPAPTQSDDEIAPYRYGPPVSPHLAAELAGEEIDPARLRAAAARGRGEAPTPSSARASAACWCRSRRDYLVRDLAVDLALPLVIAASPGLGTINHTLLTIEAARAPASRSRPSSSLPGRGAEPDRDSNRETIAALGEVAVEVLPRSTSTICAAGRSWRLIRRIADKRRALSQRRSRRGWTAQLDLEARRGSDRSDGLSAAGGFVASSRARATSPRTAFAMCETALRLPPSL